MDGEFLGKHLVYIVRKPIRENQQLLLLASGSECMWYFCRLALLILDLSDAHMTHV